MSVTIGTPLQSSAFKVLLLGSGELGKEVVISLQRLGVEVHAADRYDHAPAMQVAHYAYTLNMADATELKQLIEKIQPNLIVPEIEAIATSVLLEIEAQNIATVIPSAKAVNLTMNREGIRRLAAEELGLPTSAYRFANSLESFRAACDDIGYPNFVKPVMSSSGKGQSRVTCFDEVDAAWEYAQTGGRVNQGTVIVESQIDFDFEITLLTVRAKNPETGAIETSYCDPIGHRQDAGDYVESWQPQAMSDAALTEAKRIAHKVTTALGGCGIFGVELFVKGDKVWFSEVSPRPHDTGLVTLASQFQSEFELHARAILGLPVNTTRHSVAASAVIYAGVDATNLSFSGLNLALAHPDTDLRLFGKPEGFERRRMGVATARAETTEQARELAQQTADTVRVHLNENQN
ncbi:MULTISPECIES: formate-dependent phosphoribosylglycinamide formyltransferase [Acinetobacter]|jgi:phosphoribosylglycinamide formyltransferase 2|uniref:Formate-dependent phosphoribosylglycinamide formyltransferase n=1 Tax=Acinetobacter towneri TaxID=202956 RepID=A0ABX7TCH4_9GAMM|nr:MULTISPECIES: formate-dependent phosphoribosylglycinamide formyltransferase [Acinetobacter]MDV2454170.1 formate-dependent phosphoribosylglycinamide formyltransferase [Acinetobacter towneri]MDV2484308.1 formate-dependent phosphoribosylglycinamide formyltransferase [Acinetobacter towneri]QTD58220.1 formate-dependent phosphoribosylglycinamide formyltransferase [Acinetobacter towneri]QTD60970.1 formate-dependent phosphoribosylglycinamide formyltransferase [Acinetobacter towneri]HHW52312.1 forma